MKKNTQVESVLRIKELISELLWYKEKFGMYLNTVRIEAVITGLQSRIQMLKIDYFDLNITLPYKQG